MSINQSPNLDDSTFINPLKRIDHNMRYSFNENQFPNPLKDLNQKKETKRTYYNFINEQLLVLRSILPFIIIAGFILHSLYFLPDILKKVMIIGHKVFIENHDGAYTKSKISDSFSYQKSYLAPSGSTLNEKQLEQEHVEFNVNESNLEWNINEARQEMNVDEITDTKIIQPGLHIMNDYYRAIIDETKLHIKNKQWERCKENINDLKSIPRTSDYYSQSKQIIQTIESIIGG
jgi:hypothetical protein